MRGTDVALDAEQGREVRNDLVDVLAEEIDPAAVVGAVAVIGVGDDIPEQAVWDKVLDWRGALGRPAL
jgi:hypothetical protein